MSLVMEILEGLWNTHLYHKGARVNLLGVPKPWKQKVAIKRIHFIAPYPDYERTV